MCILIVEDEIKTAAFLQKGLQEHDLAIVFLPKDDKIVMFISGICLENSAKILHKNQRNGLKIMENHQGENHVALFFIAC